MSHTYSNYLMTIGKKFTALIDEIKGEYNFDLGHEFEIAICKALRIILPSRYGVCRGSVFTIDNRSTGDDIIIFDQWRFPCCDYLMIIITPKSKASRLSL